MKKVMMSVALISAIAIAAGYSMIGSEKSEMNMSDLTQVNVEAWANDPSEKVVVTRDCKLSLLKICETQNGDHHLYRKITEQQD